MTITVDTKHGQYEVEVLEWGINYTLKIVVDDYWQYANGYPLEEVKESLVKAFNEGYPKYLSKKLDEIDQNKVKITIDTDMFCKS